MSCNFNPSKPCSTRNRAPNRYTKADLHALARACGINPVGKTMDELCALIAAKANVVYSSPVATSYRARSPRARSPSGSRKPNKWLQFIAENKHQFPNLKGPALAQALSPLYRQQNPSVTGLTKSQARAAALEVAMEEGPHRRRKKQVAALEKFLKQPRRYESRADLPEREDEPTAEELANF